MLSVGNENLYSSMVEFVKMTKQDRTRKLSYRKGDHAMCPIYGWAKLFPESLSTPTATFSEIVNGILFRLSLYKFIAFPVPEIIGGRPAYY